METRKRRARPHPGRLLALAAVLVGATACGGEHVSRTADARAAVAVEVAGAVEEAWPGGLEVTAGVVPVQRATPGTLLMGRVEQVLVEEGDRLSAGQVLARIDSGDASAKTAQAEAAVAAARAMEHNARLMLERIERLHGRQAATQRDLDDARAGHAAARANLDAAEEGVKAARSYLAYAEVRAPFAGQLTAKRVQPGDLAAPGMPLFVVEDTSRVKIEAQVPESVGTDLAVGDAVEVEVLGERRPARLSEVVPAADPRSRTFTARAVLDNPEGRLRSGTFARMWVGGGTRGVVAVAEDAIVRRGPLTGLFVIDASDEPARARLRWVGLGRSRDGRREVLTGLAAGERYVLRPPPELEDGSPVEVRG